MSDDRLLGDEWRGWSGEIIEKEKEINEKATLFFLFYFLALFLLTIISFIIYYLISPRLKQINAVLDNIVLLFIFILNFIIYLWSLFLFLTIILKKNFLILKIGKGLHVEFLYPLLFRLGSILKISKDRIGNSLIKVNNDIIYISKIKRPVNNLLILLPRCLDKTTREKVLDLINKYNCKAFTATGGSSARQMVKKEKPDSIIGVACERDLISGMADLPKNIPIIAIPNKRKEGPCKNTTIDIEELEKAIKYFLKIEE